MKTSLTTYEDRVGKWLLNLLHRQWRALGIPFGGPQTGGTAEAIDPEALLWCSLEFFPTQPRLCEQVLAWWGRNDQSILRPRIRKLAQAQDDPRAAIWHALDPQWKVSLKPPSRPCYGQRSVQELIEFCGNISKRVPQARLQRHQPGRAECALPATLLRARDTVGADARHFVLVYLLANHGSARLRSIATWCGQTYRNVSKAAQRWESADIVSLQHGNARLRDPAIWAKVLGIGDRSVAVLNWLRLYEACLRLLRSLNKAAATSIPADSPAVALLLRETEDEAAASVESSPSTPAQTVEDLKQLLSSLR